MTFKELRLAYNAGKIEKKFVLLNLNEVNLMKTCKNFPNFYLTL